jgi:hypothetical protein
MKVRFGDGAALRASGLPGIELLPFRRRGIAGILNDDTSESAPDDASLDTGDGRRTVKEIFELIVA